MQLETAKSYPVGDTNQRNTGVPNSPGPETLSAFGGVCGRIMAERDREKCIDATRTLRRSNIRRYSGN